ncbi:putative phosphatidylcholine ceramide cholinephosphotransferase 2-like [Tupanvirus deep ocean]|uniref:Phosphatidylcholine ceramide cholinephosphotransferase 2-like n=2 Tax=Tupanvirus TaxID=2094720 RepID=A0AC62A6U8_9VIRU|nr:putative phosphatidylcholine ceramide cholinephosphotransferase 2-like [Tupanvirus deep ocean]QKU33514.1 putative phosphatidylcholine ceramide cholinephosphotransferase 2-like [Tupanvirus deep ocean]
MNLYIKLLFAVISFSIISYLNGLVALNMINPAINSPTLPDIGFRYLPQISATVPNLLLVFSCIYFAIRFFRFENLKILIDLVWCITVLFAIRLFTFTVTIVPPSTIGCINRNINDPIEWNVVKYLIFSNDNTCTDYMFSGHACYFVILFLFALQLSRYKWEKILYAVVTLLGLASIVCGHIHYTADVVVGIVLSFWCFNLIENKIIIRY